MNTVNIADLRRAAQRRLPRAIFEFIDGGSYDEVTLRAPRADFENLTFAPRVLRDVSKRDLSIELFGERLPLPLVLAPIGLCGLAAPRGEILAARAAAARGLPFCLSTAAVCSIEDVAKATGAPFWFQLYVMRDRGITRSLIERAQAADCKVLVFTVDLPVTGQRDRDQHNGFTVPPKITFANAFDMLRRPGWLREVLLGTRLTFGNFAGTSAVVENNLMSLAQHIARNMDSSISWRDIEWTRSIWKGPIVLKGILSPADARLAAEHGADAVVVSNHGGRQLDGAPSSISVLPAIVDAAGDRLSVLFDGGIRRGQDAVKAMALGARACLIGRAFMYGLAAQGEAGVTRAIDILAAEMDTTLALLGRTSISALDRSSIQVR